MRRAMLRAPQEKGFLLARVAEVARAGIYERRHVHSSASMLREPSPGGWPYRSKPDRHGVYHKRRPTRKEKGSHWDKAAQRERQQNSISGPPNADTFHWRSSILPTVHAQLSARAGFDPDVPSKENSAEREGSPADDHDRESNGTSSADSMQLADNGVDQLLASITNPAPHAQVTMRMVLEPDTEMRHPLNKKVEAEMKMADLASEGGLGPEATAFIKRVAGSRYNHNTDTLKLKSERYEFREDNFRHVCEMGAALVNEGKRYAREIGESYSASSTSAHAE